ncbi:hypothetical protein YC2023_011016 [Brassica napus]
MYLYDPYGGTPISEPITYWSCHHAAERELGGGYGKLDQNMTPEGPERTILSHPSPSLPLALWTADCSIIRLADLSR